jgi:hypothetical protein
MFAYEPDRISVPARHAAYSANLVLLAVLAAGEITEQQLFPGRAEPVEDWRRTTLLWRSQLPDEGWMGLLRTLELHRGWDGDRRILRLRVREVAEWYAMNSDPFWTHNIGPGSKPRQSGEWFGWRRDDHEIIWGQSYFLCDTKDDSVAHALEPFSGDLGTMVTTFYDFWQGRPVSAANALITLWLTASQEKSPDDLTAAYNTCLAMAIHGFAPLDIATRVRFRSHFLRQLAADFHRLPGIWLDDAIRQIKEAGMSTHSKEGPEFVRMANEILPGLMAKDPPRPS